MIPKTTLPLLIFSTRTSPTSTLSSTTITPTKVSEFRHLSRIARVSDPIRFTVLFVHLFSFSSFGSEEEGGDYGRRLVPIGALKWRKGRAVSEVPRYIEKAPKIVNVKVSPRTIQQPR